MASRKHKDLSHAFPRFPRTVLPVASLEAFGWTVAYGAGEFSLVHFLSRAGFYEILFMLLLTALYFNIVARLIVRTVAKSQV